MAALGGRYMPWLHMGLAWVTFFYNVKVILLEYRAVRQNSQIIERLNTESLSAIKKTAPSKGTDLEEKFPGADAYEWGTHVYALGKFLCFMGGNTWLPYLYIRFIMGYVDLPLLPFIFVSLGFLCGGYYLRWRYQTYRPGKRQLLSAPLGKS